MAASFPRLATALALTFVAFAGFGLARPVTVAARDGCSHDQCQTSGGSGHDGNPYGVYAMQAAGAPQPVPAGGSGPPAPARSAAPAVAHPAPTPAAVPSPALPTRPVVPPLEPDFGPSLLVGAALVGLAILVVSGFGARRRLRQGWNGGPPEPPAL